MDCQECHQRPATLHFTKILNGEMTEIHLCEQCARERGDFHPGSNSFSIHHLLSGLLDVEQQITENHKTAMPTSNVLRCEKCGTTHTQFAKSGKFGCENCYDIFQKKLDPIFKRLHGGNVEHLGKIPKRIGSDIQARKQIEQLKRQLRQHIEKEEFEKAAEVRDKIRSLDRKGE